MTVRNAYDEIGWENRNNRKIRAEKSFKYFKGKREDTRRTNRREGRNLEERGKNK
jgi:hypothetical protein